MFRRSRKQPCKPSRKKPLRKKPNGSGKRCLTLTRIAVSASIPLMIAIFTVVTYVQQQQISKHHRLQDQQIANETRLKDLQIANLTRIHDNQIAEKQREQDQQLADDLHYQTVYNKYIEDVSNVLYEQHQSSSFVDADKFQYIRSKTVTTLRDIDSAHKTYLFMFLYDNNLLPITDGIQVLKNVVLPDGTWRITSGRNLVKNGDAEKE
ncbi:unnamed protein product, partial [Didymodactylos carnosus]